MIKIVKIEQYGLSLMRSDQVIVINTIHANVISSISRNYTSHVPFFLIT